MNSWYKVAQINEKTYVISEPYHWEQTNMYYIIGENKNLLLDTGTGIYPLKELLLSIDNKEIEVITSHVHWDHIGNHSEFNTIYVHKYDSKWLELGIPLPDFMIREQVIKGVEKTKLPKDFNIEAYKAFITSNYCLVEDGYIFNLGNKKLKVIHTPGHSPGHICLHEEETGFLYTGDLLYKGVVYCNYPSTNPKHLSESIEKISKLNVTKILPGHYLTPLTRDYIDKIVSVFDDIQREDKLEHGSGIFTKDDVSVLL